MISERSTPAKLLSRSFRRNERIPDGQTRYSTGATLGIFFTYHWCRSCHLATCRVWCVSRLLRHLIPRTPTSICSWYQSHPLIPAHGVVAPDATLVSCKACIWVSQETGRTAQTIITGRMCLDPFIRSLNLLLPHFYPTSFMLLVIAFSSSPRILHSISFPAYHLIGHLPVIPFLHEPL